MKSVLAVAAAAEAAIGVALMINPSFVARLLLGDGVAGVAIALGRVAGIALLALGVACWPRSDNVGRLSPIAGLLCYNVLTTAFLIYLATAGGSAGILFWPTVGFHTAMSWLLARVVGRTGA